MRRLGSGRYQVPEINDLVRVSLGDAEDESVEFASDVPSRVEDADFERKSGNPKVYLIAAPWFSGDLELPERGSPCALQWTSPQGRWLLPAAFEAQETTSHGLRVWRVKVTGDPRRNERRRYVRVEWAVPAKLMPRKDVGALPHTARERIERCGVTPLLADLPDEIAAMTSDVGEGGLRLLGPEPPLPQGAPLQIDFALEKHEFSMLAHVIWSLRRPDARKEQAVESAVAFEDPGRHGEELRPLVFAAQLKARRAQLL